MGQIKAAAMNFKTPFYVIHKNEICKFVNDKSIQWNDFKNKRFLISGATGLIGATLVNSILVANQKYDINCQLYLLVIVVFMR